MSIILKSPNDILLQIAVNFKKLRLNQKLTQEGLAKRSGVSWGSVKRFESSGQISLQSLLKIALVLDTLSEFEALGKLKENDFNALSLDEILEQKKKPKKGFLK